MISSIFTTVGAILGASAVKAGAGGKAVLAAKAVAGTAGSPILAGIIVGGMIGYGVAKFVEKVNFSSNKNSKYHIQATPQTFKETQYKYKQLEEEFYKQFPLWNDKIKQGINKQGKIYNIVMKKNGEEDEHCFIVAGAVDNRVFPRHAVVSKIDNTRQGLLHIISRHYNQFARHTNFRTRLSLQCMIYLQKCANARDSDREEAYKDLRNHLDQNINDRINMEQFQVNVFHFLREQMTQDNFEGIDVVDGRTLYHFRVGNSILRVILTAETYQGFRGGSHSSRLFKEIITAFFVDPKKIKNKLLNAKKPNSNH